MDVYMKSRSFVRILLCTMIIMIPNFALAWEGYVWKVIDGDTLTVVPSGVSEADAESAGVGIRLYGIDAPELNQPGGVESRTALGDMVKRGDTVQIIPIESDRYDRSVALVQIGDHILNLEQVRNGQAHVSEKYCRARFCKDWKKVESANK